MLCSSHKSCSEQPAPLVSHTPLHTSILPCPAKQHRGASQHLSRMIMPLLLLLFIYNTCWNKANPMPFGCCSFILFKSKWAHAGCTHCHNTTKKPLHLPLIQINLVFPTNIPTVLIWYFIDSNCSPAPVKIQRLSWKRKYFSPFCYSSICLWEGGTSETGSTTEPAVSDMDIQLPPFQLAASGTPE